MSRPAYYNVSINEAVVASTTILSSTTAVTASITLYILLFPTFPFF